MNIKKDERIQLNNLCKILTGKSSQWQKKLKNGIPFQMEREAKDGSTEIYTGVKYLTVAEIKEQMQKDLETKLAKDKEEAERKETAQKELEANQAKLASETKND